MNTDSRLDREFGPTDDPSLTAAEALAAARWKDKLFLAWHAVNVLMFMGTVMTCMIAVVDRAVVPLANGLAIGLVASWVVLMASQIVSAVRDSTRATRERRAELEAIAAGMHLTPEQVRALQHDIERIYGH